MPVNRVKKEARRQVIMREEANLSRRIDSLPKKSVVIKKENGGEYVLWSRILKIRKILERKRLASSIRATRAKSDAAWESTKNPETTRLGRKDFIRMNLKLERMRDKPKLPR